MQSTLLRSWLPLFVASTLFLIGTQPEATVHAGKRLPQEQYVGGGLQGDLAELDSYLSYRDLDTLQGIVDRKSQKWRNEDYSSFIVYMSKACSLLSSYDVGDMSKRASLLSGYAISALTSGNLPIKDQILFVEFLMFDPLKIDEVPWRSLREQKARLWLATRRRVAGSVDPAFDINDFPLLNVPAPAGSRMPAGSPPESIKDPKLRAEYDAAIAANSVKAQHYNEQYWLKRNAPRFYEETERYLENAYSRPPVDLAQLERLLSQYIDDNGLREKILEKVRERTSE